MEFQALYHNPGQKPTAGVDLCPGVKLAIIILLNSLVVKLPSKYSGYVIDMRCSQHKASFCSGQKPVDACLVNVLEMGTKCWEDCCEVESSRPDMTITHINSQDLLLPATKARETLVWMG